MLGEWVAKTPGIVSGLHHIPHIPVFLVPICPMYGIFTYIWVIFSAHVGKYSIHEAYGVGEVGSVGALCRKKN